MVIVLTPLINYVSGFVQRSEPIGIQALFTELAIETFNECISRRLAWLDKGELHTGFLRPKEHRLAGEFSPVVADVRPRSLPLKDQIV